MIDPTYALLWPRPLFEWEARRILDLPPETPEWVSMVGHLLLEAYEEEDVAGAFAADVPSHNVWARSAGLVQSEVPARTWLSDLLNDDSRLQPYKAPVYWAERNGGEGILAATDKPYESFADDFFELIGELEGAGYFPNALKKDCVDDPIDLDEVRKAIRRATKLDIKWPMSPGDILALSDDAVYTHSSSIFTTKPRDREQQPFTSTETVACTIKAGTAESGQSVYRWRVNKLLERHRRPLRLGTSGEEQGRLITHFDSPLDDLAASEINKRADEPEDEVAHAVRKFRARGASIAEKRAAVVMLYGQLEPKRKSIGRKLSSGDESDLFRIANTFNLRHRDKSQKADYGEELLDWVFWTNLSTLRLLDELARRQDAPGSVSKGASA